MSYNLSTLRSATDDELIQAHDDAAQHTVVGINYFLEELRHRDLARSSAASALLARRALVLTMANTVLAVLATMAALIALFR